MRACCCCLSVARGQHEDILQNLSALSVQNVRESKQPLVKLRGCCQRPYAQEPKRAFLSPYLERYWPTVSEFSRQSEPTRRLLTSALNGCLDRPRPIQSSSERAQRVGRRPKPIRYITLRLHIHNTVFGTQDIAGLLQRVNWALKADLVKVGPSGFWL